MTYYRTLLWIVFLFLVAPGLAREQTPEERQLQIESFEKVWTIIRDKHWDPKLGGLDWQAIHDEFRPRIERANTPAQARSVMNSMIDRLHQSHFVVIPSDVYQQIEPAAKPAPEKSSGDPTSSPARTPAASAKDPKSGDSSGEPVSGDKESPEANGSLEDGTTGLDVSVVDGDALVTSVEPGSPAAAQGVRLGWQVVKIEGKALAPIFEGIGKAIEDSTLEARLLERAVVSRLKGKVGKNVQVEFLDGDDKTVELEIPRARPKGTRAEFGNLPVQHVWFESRALESAGYIAFNIFLDPANLMVAFEKAVKSFMQSDGIIIDLRGNPGGLGAMAMGMAGWFIDRPDQRLGVMHTRQTSLKFVVIPRLQTYRGPLAILVDAGSASTSEIFAGGMKDLGRARIFGTRTAGAALPSVIEKLPNGDRFQYAFANYISEGGKPLEGNGVIPDVEVMPTRESLRQGRDAVKEAALEWIRTRKKTQ